MKAEKLFDAICERCESYAKGENCEDRDTCPAYQLYCMANKKRNSKETSWDTTPRNSECLAASAPTGWI